MLTALERYTAIFRADAIRDQHRVLRVLATDDVFHAQDVLLTQMETNICTLANMIEGVGTSPLVRQKVVSELQGVRNDLDYWSLDIDGIPRTESHQRLHAVEDIHPELRPARAPIELTQPFLRVALEVPNAALRLAVELVGPLPMPLLVPAGDVRRAALLLALPRLLRLVQLVAMPRPLQVAAVMKEQPDRDDESDKRHISLRHSHRRNRHARV